MGVEIDVSTIMKGGFGNVARGFVTFGRATLGGVVNAGGGWLEACFSSCLTHVHLQPPVDNALVLCSTV